MTQLAAVDAPPPWSRLGATRRRETSWMAKREKPGDQRAWAEDVLRREAAGERISRAERRRARRVLAEQWKPSVTTEATNQASTVQEPTAARLAQIEAEKQSALDSLQRDSDARMAELQARYDERVAAGDAELEATKAQIQSKTQEGRETSQRRYEAEVAAENAGHKAKMAALQAELDALPEDD